MSPAQTPSPTAADRCEQPDQTVAAGGARPDELETPVIILSSLPEATVRAQADGVAAILRKPYTAGEVLRAIGQVLGEADQPRT